MDTAQSSEAKPHIIWQGGRADVLYECFKKCIIDGEWTAGQALNINSLARDYAVSITPVREALARLTADKLVVAALNRGYTVAPRPTSTHLADLCAVRLLIEPAAARGAALHMTASSLADLDRMHQAISALPDSSTYEVSQSFATLNRRFHHIIFQLNGNRVLSEMYDQLGYHVLIGHVYHTHGIEDLPQIVAEHCVIREALAARDPVAAEAAMYDHIERGSKRLLASHTVAAY